MLGILGVIVVVIGLSQADLSDEYKNNIKLDDSYMMYWTHNNSESAVYFAVRAKAVGWVGFGFANKIDNMKGYDVAVGYVTLTKNSFDLRDYHTTGHAPPVIDTKQSLENTSASEANGFTTLKFKRRLDTGDKNEDIVIKPGQMIVVWSYSSVDDVTKKHDAKGHKTVTLIPVESHNDTTPTTGTSMTTEPMSKADVCQVKWALFALSTVLFMVFSGLSLA